MVDGFRYIVATDLESLRHLSHSEHRSALRRRAYLQIDTAKTVAEQDLHASSTLPLPVMSRVA